MSEEKYLGRIVKEKHSFKVDGTFESLYAAQSWCHQNGYKSGSLCRDMPVAIQKGGYELPQKWKNFDAQDELKADGLITSNDFREGEVTIYIFN